MPHHQNLADFIVVDYVDCPLTRTKENTMSYPDTSKVKSGVSGPFLKYLCPKCGKEVLAPTKFTQEGIVHHIRKLYADENARLCETCGDPRNRLAEKVKLMMYDGQSARAIVDYVLDTTVEIK